MNETNWKPTEDILVSLGFVKLELPNEEGMYMFRSEEGKIVFDTTHGLWNMHLLETNPKSLEELRILISMMKP